MPTIARIAIDPRAALDAETRHRYELATRPTATSIVDTCFRRCSTMIIDAERSAKYPSWFGLLKPSSARFVALLALSTARPTWERIDSNVSFPVTHKK